MNRKGFTLIELMIVIVIVGILAAVAIPKFTEASRKASLYETLVPKGYANGKIDGAFDRVKSRYSKDGIFLPTDKSQLASLVEFELKGIKPTPKVKKSNNAVPAAPTKTVSKSTPTVTDIQSMGEYVLIGKDADVIKVINELKKSQDENGYKYIDSVFQDGTTVKVKLRKY